MPLEISYFVLADTETAIAPRPLNAEVNGVEDKSAVDTEEAAAVHNLLQVSSAFFTSFSMSILKFFCNRLLFVVTDL
jgi:hypothetical protein